jgi:hypothetical protein
MDRECSGRRKNGQKCHAPAIRGGTACWRHTPNPKARAMAAVRAEVTRWGLGDTTIDPGETLLRLVSQSAARAQRYAAELEDLVVEETSLRKALVGDSFTADTEGRLHKVGEYIRGLAQVEAAERDRCAAFAAKAIAAGLAERQVRLAERQGALIADVLRAVMGDPTLGLSEEQRALMPGVIRRHLAAVSA